MKTDRELLELAGKAADIPARVIGAYPGSYNCGERGWHMQWNPLENDGDALRLAVKLKMNLHVFDKACAAMTNLCALSEVYEGDHCAHLRRAIVRAAAVIGEKP